MLPGRYYSWLGALEDHQYTEAGDAKPRLLVDGFG